MREITDADLSGLVEISYYDGKQAASVLEAREMNERIRKDYEQGNSIHWGIADADDRIVGTCGYYRGFGNDSGELGCVLLPAYRGKGYMTLALQAAIGFGFREARLRSVWAVTSPENAAAIRLLKRLGFRKIEANEGGVRFEVSMDDTGK